MRSHADPWHSEASWLASNSPATSSVRLVYRCTDFKLTPMYRLRLFRLDRLLLLLPPFEHVMATAAFNTGPHWRLSCHRVSRHPRVPPVRCGDPMFKRLGPDLRTGIYSTPNKMKRVCKYSPICEAMAIPTTRRRWKSFERSRRPSTPKCVTHRALWSSRLMLAQRLVPRTYGYMWRRYRYRVLVAMSAQLMAQLNGINGAVRPLILLRLG